MNLLESLPQGLNGLEQLHALIALGGRPPIGELLDFTLIEAARGSAVFEGIPGIQAYNPLGSVHGGYAATLLDSACGCAVHSRLAIGQGYTTLELKVSYQKALTIKTGLIRAIGKVLTFGRRAAFAEATLIDSDGRLYASASSTLLIFDLPTKSPKVPDNVGHLSR